MLKEIQEKIDQLSREKKQDAMIEFLKKELTQARVSPQELYDYAVCYSWKSNTSRVDYVINASSSNLLGIVIFNLRISPEIATKFFKLAADRGSNWGCRNYASTTYHHNSIEAETYLKKAMELSAATEQKEFQLLYAKILWENKAFRDANVALNAYLNHKISLFYQDTQNKSEHRQDLDAGIMICTARLAFYQQVVENAVDAVAIESCIAELTPFLNGYIAHYDPYAAVLSVAAYLKGSLHEQLAQPSQAMQAYAKVTDRQYCHYADSVASRSRLMQENIEHHLQLTGSAAEVDALTLSTSQLELTDTQVPPAIHREHHAFSQLWQCGDERMDFVDAIELKRVLDEQNDPLRMSLREKRIELEAIEERLEKRDVETPRLVEQSALLEIEIAAIRKTLTYNNEKHQQREPGKREILRRHLAEKTFFTPRRIRKKTTLFALTTALVEQRFNGQNNNRLRPLILTGLSARQLITAEAAFQSSTADLMALDKYSKPSTLGFPVCRTSPWSFDDGPSGENTFGPVESYRVGDTAIDAEHRANPKMERMGTSYVCEIKTYDKIFRFLNNICQDEAVKERVLAGYLIRYGKNHQSITLEELQALNPYVTRSDVDEFNRVCFLIIEKEQSQWHSATYDYYQLGMAVSQARCLILLQEGIIRFADAFKNSAKYGVYSQYDLLKSPSLVAQACKEIDALYKQHLCRDLQVTSILFKRVNQAQVEVVNPTVVLSQKQARADLRQVYGDDSDSDGEGYETDISISSRP